MISRSSRRMGARDKNSRRPRNEMKANRTSVACHPASRAAPSSAAITHQRVTSWWVMAALLGAALLAGWQATLVLFAFISFLGLREFLSLAPMRREDRLIILLAYLTIIANYAFLYLDRYGIYLVFIPVYVFLVTPFLMARIGQTRAYLPTAAVIQWGMVTCVYNLGFAAYLARAPLSQAPQAG